MMTVSTVFLYVFGSFCSFAFWICFNDFLTRINILPIAKALSFIMTLGRWGSFSVRIAQISILKLIKRMLIVP